MEYLMKKIADIAKEKNCAISLEIIPDGRLMIGADTVRRDYRIINYDWSEENILNTVRDVIRTAEE